MSGRVHHTLADGRRVIGFRKTLTQRKRRTPPHLLPDWELSFVLPPMLGAFLHPGATDVIGVHLNPGGHVEVVGKNREWVIRQGAAFLHKLGAGRFFGPVNARLTRAAEAGPTLSGPLRPAEHRAIQFEFVDGATVLVSGASMRALQVA